MKNRLFILFSTFKTFAKDNRLLRSFLANLFYYSSLKKRNHLFIALTEHLGDIIAAEPISRHLKTHSPGKELIWIVNEKYVDLVKYNPSINKIRTVTCFTEWILLRKFISKKHLYDLHISGKVCDKHGFHLVNSNAAGINIDNYFDKGNLLSCFSQTAGIEMDATTAALVHVPSIPTPISGTIVVHTSTNSPRKNWQNREWDHLVQRFDEWLQPDKIVEIGYTSQIDVDHAKLVRYVGEKQPGEIRSLIEQCSLFVGVESGFAHMANALQKKSIILIGRLHGFQQYMPYSGKFLKEAQQTIIYSNKPLAETTFQELEPRLLELIKIKKAAP